MSDMTFDQQPKLSSTLAQPSFSPLMQKIEEAMESKFMSFMETLKNERRTLDLTQLQDTMRNAVMNDVNQSLAEAIGNIGDPETVS